MAFVYHIIPDLQIRKVVDLLSLKFFLLSFLFLLGAEYIALRYYYKFNERIFKPFCVVKDYIKIEYRDGGNLYILATGLDVIQKYASADAQPVCLPVLP